MDEDGKYSPSTELDLNPDLISHNNRPVNPDLGSMIMWEELLAKFILIWT